MSLFKINKKKPEEYKFDKYEIIEEILNNREHCPGWNFFRIRSEIVSSGNSDINAIYDSYSGFNKINCDFLAIYTDVINKEIRIKGNPFTEYKNVIQSAYQIVREIYITDQNSFNEDESIYKRINAKSAKELFIKLKKELE